MLSLTGYQKHPPALEGSTFHIGAPAAELKPYPQFVSGAAGLKTLLLVSILAAAVACSDPPQDDASKPGEPDVDGGAEADLPSPTPDADAPPRPDAENDVRESQPDATPDVPPDFGNPDCDELEPNGTPGSASETAEDGGWISSRVCARDQDWFRIAASRGDRIDVLVEFSHDEGDLDLIVLGPDLLERARAESSDDNERVSADVDETGPWWIQIYGYEGAEADYRISVRRVAGGGACPDDTMEPDDAPHTAVTVLPPHASAARLCPGAEDYRAIYMRAGARLNVAAEFEHAQGDLDLELLGVGGDIVASSRTTTDNEGLGIEIEDGGLYTLRVHGFEVADDGLDYSLRITTRDQPAPEQVARGYATYHDPFWDDAANQLGFLERPLAGALVEIIDAGEIVGAGYTDGRGMFAVPYAAAGSELYARVVAFRAGPAAHVAVVDSERRIYAVRQPGTFTAGTAEDISILLTDGTSLSAPFNALGSAVEGLEWWRRTIRQGAPVPLHVLWQEGQRLACGTCYRDADEPRTIYLYGVTEDNDALDDPVILHELGHFLSNIYSGDDSPGGSHDGGPVDPRLAWAEGWATAFSGMVRGEPVYYDTRGDRITRHDIETPDPDYGTFTGQRLTDPISEYLVAAILYDLWDSQDDDGDIVSAGPGALRPVVEHLRDGQRAIRGVDGVDLVDYLDGAFCQDIADAQAMEARLVHAQLPYVRRDAQCQKASVPLTVTATHVIPRRPLDGLSLWRCDGVCTLAHRYGKLSRGARVPIPKGSGRLELTAHRGHHQWSWIEPTSVAGPNLWSPAPRASDGSEVVQRTARVSR